MGNFHVFKSPKQGYKSRGQIRKYKSFYTQMNKLTLQLCLLTFFVSLSLSDSLLTEKAGLSTEPFYCDKNLYKSLSKLKGRIKGSGIQFDLLRTLNKTDVNDPKKVLQRVSHYDFNGIKDYLDLLDQSYAFEQAYVKYSSESKASLDYQNVCSDLCPTYTTYNGFRTPKNMINNPKPGNIDNFTCSIPDNPFCNDGLQFADVKDENLLQATADQLIKRDHIGRILVYKNYLGGDLEYCYTIDEQYQKIVHMCEKYEQYLIATRGYLKSQAFHEQAYETVLTGDPDSQTAINYIMTKMKFGERLGAIYNDCRRYGKLPTDIKKPIL